MNNEIEHIVVTGASSGIGLNITASLIQGGKYYVVGIDKSNAPDELIDARYSHIKVDLSNLHETEALINKFIKEKSIKKIKGLINSAGIMPSMLLSKIELDKALDVFSVNSIAPVLMSKLFFRQLAKARPSFIINITSIAAEINIPGEGFYSSTKSALKTLTEYMSLEYARFGIRVNSVAPALVRTPMTLHLTTEQVEYMQTKQALNREIEVQDVTEIVNFLINAPDSLTGSTLYVGGISK